MTLLDWQTDFECGVVSIDHEHRQLIEVINDLYARIGDDSGNDEVTRLLGEIHGLIESHFALEEKLMRDASYANYGPHKADHDRLLDDIRDIMDSVHGGSDPVGEPLAQRLRAWFSDHFRTLDRDLHKLAGH